MKEIKIEAPAKINLSLDIIDVEDDGYHKLEMIMQTINLHDIITIKEASNKEIKLYNINSDLPVDNRNLAYQAAELILNEANLHKGVNITIEKNIPVAAGLAGGSTDAAGVLKGINELFDLNFSYEKLKKLGAQLGMDVPFCLKGGTALATGKGDIITPLPDLVPQELVLINPSSKLLTSEVYKKYDELYENNTNRVQVPTSKLIKVIKNNDDIRGNEGWVNVLELAAETMDEDIKTVKKMLEKFNPKLTMMTGSGPTVFAILHDKKQGLDIKNNWTRDNDIVITSSTVKRSS